MKKLISKYPQCWVLLYFLIYLPWFCLLEQRDTSQCWIIHLEIDEKIPFCEYFVVPYLLWFVYVAAGIGYMLFTRPKEEFYRFVGVLFGGMTVCLAVYTVFFTGLDLRPRIDESKNIFCWLVARIWEVDTSTNVCPSIHVFATLAIYSGMARSGFGLRHPALHGASLVLSVLIILSTMLLKQHSVLDVIMAFSLAALLERAVYHDDPIYAAARRLDYQRG